MGGRGAKGERKTPCSWRVPGPCAATPDQRTRPAGLSGGAAGLWGRRPTPRGPFPHTGKEQGGQDENRTTRADGVGGRRAAVGREARRRGAPVARRGRTVWARRAEHSRGATGRRGTLDPPAKWTRDRQGQCHGTAPSGLGALHAVSVAKGGPLGVKGQWRGGRPPARDRSPGTPPAPSPRRGTAPHAAATVRGAGARAGAVTAKGTCLHRTPGAGELAPCALGTRQRREGPRHPENARHRPDLAHEAPRFCCYCCTVLVCRQSLETNDIILRGTF